MMDQLHDTASEQPEEVIPSLPAWKLGERESLLLEDPVLLLMAVPLRQRLNWDRQVLPALQHYRQSFARESLFYFYSAILRSVTTGYREWGEGARTLWGRAYAQSARRLFNILAYVAHYRSGWECGEENSDWELLRQSLLLCSREEVLASIRGVGASSWAFLAYYLTYFPPEESTDQILRLYEQVTGHSVTSDLRIRDVGVADTQASQHSALDLARGAWLYLLDKGVLHDRGLL